MNFPLHSLLSTTTSTFSFSFYPMAALSPQPMAAPTLTTLSIPYAHLLDRSMDLSEKIESAFGPEGLGVLSVSDVPGFPELRKNLLQLSPRLACLPDEAKEKLEDEESSYNFGWSHGKEKLESGKADVLKGSFYANPILDMPTNDLSLIQRYPPYCRANIWPSQDLPELESAFKRLGKLMLDVGLLLARHCDHYVSRFKELDHSKGLEQILINSRCHKGRLLYYFPKKCSDFTPDSSSLSSWCGWHTDHGSLTGLTCAMYTRDSLEINCPDVDAGLYIKTRNNDIVKVVFGVDEIAYQIGETTEILSGGYLCATPHCVRGSMTILVSDTFGEDKNFQDNAYLAPSREKAFGIDRSTFALFMQPDWDEKLNFPSEVHLHQGRIPPNGALTFGEYSDIVINKYYGQ